MGGFIAVVLGVPVRAPAEVPAKMHFRPQAIPPRPSARIRSQSRARLCGSRARSILDKDGSLSCDQCYGAHV